MSYTMTPEKDEIISNSWNFVQISLYLYASIQIGLHCDILPQPYF